MSIAVAEQLRGDRVAVGLVVDQDTAQVVAGGRSLSASSYALCVLFHFMFFGFVVPA